MLESLREVASEHTDGGQTRLWQPEVVFPRGRKTRAYCESHCIGQLTLCRAVYGVLEWRNQQY